MSKICPVCQREYPDENKFCSICEDVNGMPVRLVLRTKFPSGGVNLGDANAVSGGIHTTTDSHNVHNESHVTNNVTNVAAQKTEMELLQEKKNIYLAECKRAYEDNVLEQSEIIALEECRLKLGLDEATAKGILESVRLLADRNTRKTSLNPIAKTKLKILSDNLQNNNVPALQDQIGNLEAIVNKFEHDELHRKYFLALSVLNPKKCIELKEGSQIDSYWKSYWCYLAYIKEGMQSKAETLLAGMDRFADYPEDNVTILAIAGSLISGNVVEAKELLSAVTGEYTTELQRFVDSIYLILDPEKAKGMGADESACAFYLSNLFGQNDSEIEMNDSIVYTQIDHVHFTISDMGDDVPQKTEPTPYKRSYSEDEVRAHCIDDFGYLRELNPDEIPVIKDELLSLPSNSPWKKSMLGQLYLQESTSASNLRKAYDELKDAAERGENEAAVMMAYFYMHGKVVEQDLYEAESRIKLDDDYKKNPALIHLLIEIFEMRGNAMSADLWRGRLSKL